MIKPPHGLGHLWNNNTTKLNNRWTITPRSQAIPFYVSSSCTFDKVGWSLPGPVMSAQENTEYMSCPWQSLRNMWTSWLCASGAGAPGGRGSGPVVADASCSDGGVCVNNEYSLRGSVTAGSDVRPGAASSFAPAGACVRSEQGRVRESFYYFCLLWSCHPCCLPFSALLSR